MDYWLTLLLPKVLVQVINEYDGRYPQEAWQFRTENSKCVCFGTQILSKCQQWTFHIHSGVHYIGISTSLIDIQSLKTDYLYKDEISFDADLNIYEPNDLTSFLITEEYIHVGDSVHLLLDGNHFYMALNHGSFYLVHDHLLSSLKYYPYCLTMDAFATPL